MEEYLINTTVNTKDWYGGNNCQQFVFKIYKNGNVIVTSQYKDCRSGDGPVWTLLEIKDNIPLREYVISILKKLLGITYVSETVNDCERCVKYYMMLIDILKMVKEQKYDETKQIDFYMKQTEEIENKLTEKDIYVESIENKCTKLSNINKELYKQIEETENKLTEKDIYIESIENKYAESLKVIEELKKQITMKGHHIYNIKSQLNDSQNLTKTLDSKNIILTDKNNTLKDSINYCSKKCWCYHNIDCNFK
jgi:hypothetical protein